MTDRGIIMNAPMVKALLDGTKTQTRRLAWRLTTHQGRYCEAPTVWQRVKPGDRLWVRETHYVVNAGYKDGSGQLIWYRASNPDAPVGPWTPSIHMPRWASRLTLVVTEARRQRLQEISDPDAEAEGVEFETADPPFWYVPGIMPHSLTAVETKEGASASYAKLWNHLHGDGAWAENPEVVALTFTVHQINIDQFGEEAA